MSDMKQLTIKCPITIKAVVTDALKTHLAADMQDAIKKADMELQQIEFHAKRMMAEQARQDAQGLIAMRQQVDAEKQKRVDFKSHLLEKIKETAQLEIGAEIVQGTMEQLVTVSVGDDLHKIMATEILLEDGKIVAFRN